MLSRFEQIPVADLQLGMFIAELDRPWLQTPFLVEGLLLRDEADLNTVVEMCQHVVIDHGKSPAIIKKQTPRVSIGKSIKDTFPARKLRDYTPTKSLDDELESARDIYLEYEQATTAIFEQIASGQSINMKTADEAVSAVVDSLVRNPAACTLLQQIRKKGNVLYNHAMGTSVWSAAIGRQIGLPPIDLKRLAISGLLCDIGKVFIPSRILTKPSELDQDEIEKIKSHVKVDDAFRAQFPGLADSVMEIIETHHERHDGSGYPKGLHGDYIPVFARIVGLADSYEAMTSTRPHAKAMSSYDAARELYDLRDIHYQAEIVEEFIQAVGIYPVGSLVELSNGEVGVVVDIYQKRRLRPKILMLLDNEKQVRSDIYYIDLLEQKVDQNGEPLAITHSLAPGSYGLDTDAFFA